MVDVSAIIWDLSFSIIALLVHHFISALMAVTSSTSSTPPPSPPLRWKRAPDLSTPVTSKRSKENSMHDQCAFEALVPRRWGDGYMMATSETMADGSGGVGSPVELGKLKVMRRPAMLVIPDSMTTHPPMSASEDDLGAKDLEMERDVYCMASRRGSKIVMEDGYEAIPNICGDSKQAYFGVYDGHGGRAAVDFVCENLGKNIIRALHENQEAVDLAIRTGYLTTDQDFLSLNLGSGVCTATLLLKDGELHAANAGDCRVVLSRNGIAHALTRDHCAGRDDERCRIENTGGYVNCHNGVWRVEKSLSISRAIGDLHMKEWIISEPEINSVQLTSDCDFAIMASDGLWNKVSDQEAVDVILKGRNPLQSCKSLIQFSSSRGSRDDITVMLIHLQKFLK